MTNTGNKKANSKADEKTRGETYQQFRKLYEHCIDYRKTPPTTT
jgi:hypothetical protein